MAVNITPLTKLSDASRIARQPHESFLLIQPSKDSAASAITSPTRMRSTPRSGLIESPILLNILSQKRSGGATTRKNVRAKTLFNAGNGMASACTARKSSGLHYCGSSISNVSTATQHSPDNLGHLTTKSHSPEAAAMSRITSFLAAAFATLESTTLQPMSSPLGYFTVTVN